MTVENQFPYQTYTANGTDSSFALGFYVENKSNFIVKIDDVVVSNTNYIYDKNTNSILFNVAPVAGKIITIQRDTSADRSVNYSTYNNTFRPETLNFDLDRIWLKAQELWVQITLLWTQVGLLWVALNQEIQDRLNADNHLNTRIDTEIQDRTIGDSNTLSSANSYTKNYVSDIVRSIAAGGGASTDILVSTVFGITQRELNVETHKLLGGYVSSDSVGLIPNSNEDQTEKLRAFFEIGGALKLKKGVYKLKGNPLDITIKANTFLDAEGAVLDYSEATNESTGRLRTLSGGVILRSSNLTVDAAQFTHSVTVVDATGFSVGDVVYLRANDAFSTDTLKGEVLKISSITGNTLSFNEKLQVSYLVSNTARIEKVESTKNIFISGLKMIGRGSLLSAGSLGVNDRAMLLSYVENIVVRNCEIVDFDRMGIHVNNAYLFHIDKNMIQQPTRKVVANYNQYAICYTDCTRHGFISGNTVLQGKHAIVSSTYTGKGYAVGVDISHNIINNTWHAAIATHKTNSELSVLDNRIDGSVFGVDIRVPNVTVSGNVITNTSSRAIVLRDSFNNLRISDNILRNGFYGIYVESGEITSNISDISIRDNDFSGFTNTNIEFATSTYTVSDLSIKNNVLKDFRSNAIRMTGNYGFSEILQNEFYSTISNGYAIRLLGVTGVLIEKNKFIDVLPIRLEPDVNNVVNSRISVLENKWNRDTNLISAVTGSVNNLLRYRNLQLGKSFTIVPIVSNAITISAGLPFIIADSTTDTVINTINSNAMHGDELILTIARSVITINSTGNIRLASDCVMNNPNQTLKLVFNGVFWCEVGRCVY